MKTILTIFLCTFVLFLWGLWFTAPWLMHFLDVNWNLSEVGPWGDSFGVLNTLFSGLGFVAVVRTLMLQSEQLARQQKEISEQQTRLDAADRETQIHQFERTFFQLLGLFREARDEVSCVGFDGETYQGREGFEQAGKLLLMQLRPYSSFNSNEDRARLIAKAYREHVHVTAEQTLGPYYRLLYTLLRRISENEILVDQEKIRYGNLIRSQLSSAEVVCIVANGLTKEANNFKDYLEEFRIPKYLQRGSFRDAIAKIYDAKSLSARD